MEFEEHLRGELKKTVEKRSDKDDKRFADSFRSSDVPVTAVKIRMWKSADQ